MCTSWPWYMIENIFVVFISPLLFDVLELKCFTLNYCRDAIKFVEIFIAVVSCSFLLAFFQLQLHARNISEIRNQAFIGVISKFTNWHFTFFLGYVEVNAVLLKLPPKLYQFRHNPSAINIKQDKIRMATILLNYQRHYHWARSC